MNAKGLASASCAIIAKTLSRRKWIVTDARDPATTPPSFGIARASTLGFGLAITIAFILWVPTATDPLWIRLTVGAMAAITVFIACPASMIWIKHVEALQRHDRHTPDGACQRRHGRRIES